MMSHTPQYVEGAREGRRGVGEGFVSSLFKFVPPPVSGEMAIVIHI